MMKAFAAVVRGFEDVAASEIREIAAAEIISSGGGVVVFDAAERDLCAVAYRSQSASRVCCLVAEFGVGEGLAATVANLKEKLGGFSIMEWTGEGTFSIECERFGSHGFNSQEFLIEASKLISSASDARVNFKHALLKLFCFISGSSGFLGVDVAGFDLSKRDYRIFGHASDLKANAAYSLVRLSGFDGKKSLLDPFSRSGAIAIEAALFASGTSPNYYRKDSFAFLRLKPFSGIGFGELFRSIDGGAGSGKCRVFNYGLVVPHLKCAEKNAKIAGVNKLIGFSRVDTEFLDLKFGAGGVDAIVSYPPMISKCRSEASAKKLYGLFFRRASAILSGSGRVVLASRDERELSGAASASGFRISGKKVFSCGREEGNAALVFVRA